MCHCLVEVRCALGGEWGTLFGHTVVATAMVDRLLHHSHVLTIRGDSYRLREKRRSGLFKSAAEAEPKTKRHEEKTSDRCRQKAPDEWSAPLRVDRTGDLN